MPAWCTVHVCRFAIVEAKLALVRLLQGLSFKLHERTALPLRTKTGITHAPSEGVWVTVQARS